MNECMRCRKLYEKERIDISSKRINPFGYCDSCKDKIKNRYRLSRDKAGIKFIFSDPPQFANKGNDCYEVTATMGEVSAVGKMFDDIWPNLRKATEE